MDLEKKFEDETGEEATWRYDREDLYTVEYVKWLEQRIEAGQHETIVVLPNDIDDFLTEVTDNDGWVFSRGKWQKYGWRSRTTKELYYLHQRDKARFGT